MKEIDEVVVKYRGWLGAFAKIDSKSEIPSALIYVEGDGGLKCLVQAIFETYFSLAIVNVASG